MFACLRRCCPLSRPRCASSDWLPDYAVEGTRIPVDEEVERPALGLEAHLEHGARDLSWELLYDLDEHGASLSSLKSCLSGSRQDPRVLKVVAADGAVFGGVWYGARDGACTMVYSGKGSDLVVHSAVKQAEARLTDDSFSLGLKSGTGVAVWLDDALDYGFSAPSDLFQSPGLAATHNFRCVRFQVWTPAADPVKRFASPPLRLSSG